MKRTLVMRMVLAFGTGTISATGFGDATAVGLIWETNLSAPPAPGTERLPAIADTPVERAIALRASQLAPGPWGDYYYFALDATGRTSVSRLSGTDDTMVWHGSVSGFVPWAGGQVLDGQALPDGGVQAVLGGIARFSASGQLLWSRAVGVGSYAPEPARVLYRSGGDALIAKQAREYPPTSLPTVARVDASTGAAVSARAIAGTPGSSCDIAWVAVGTDDAAYLTQACRRAGSDTRDYSLARLAEDFSSVWTVTLPAGVTLDAPYEARGVADGAGVYVVERSAGTGASLVKRSAADGAVLWRLAGEVDRLSIDTAGRLLAIDAMDDAYRLTVVDAATGQALWTQIQAGRDPIVDGAVDALYVAATEVSKNAGFLERRDPATGVVQWRTPIAAAIAGRTFRPRDVLASGSSVRISGSDCLPWVACASALVRLDSVDGQIRAYRWPEVAQSLLARLEPGADGSLLISSLERGEGVQRVHVRQVDQDGVAIWERLFPIDTPLTLQEGHAQWTGDGDILISANTGRIDASVPGSPYLAKYSTSGVLRWQRLLTQGEQQRGASFHADSDADGNVYVSASIALAQPGGQGYLSARSLMRLDAATGEPIWTVPFQTLEGQAAPPAFDRVEQGLLVLEPPQSVIGEGVTMLSTTDGSVRWRHTEPTARGASLLAASGGVGYLQTAVDIRALSLDSGEQRWTYRYTPVAGETPQFTVADFAGGDLFVGGSLAGAQSSGVVLRLSGSDGVPRWINRFAESAGMSSDRVLFVRLEELSLGLVQVSNGKQLWTRLDRDDGRFLDSSVLTLRSTFDEALAFRGGAVGPRTPDGGMLVYGEAYWPGRPRTAWIGGLAAPEAGTRGNLAVSLSVPPAADASDRFALSAEVSYTGDDTVDKALAYVRWTAAEPNTRIGDALIASAPACHVTGGGQCRLTQTPAGLRIELESLSPGSTARITAALTRITDADGISIEAFGPYGLFETDMRDNRAVDTQVWDVLLCDGFE
ncbi:MAG TPA: PQQ-binding-like beta-propeller repeat protein [Dokdonella sp.]|uniref:outer membrane protein assembly factor BamB family protein n=1 Tax=Dokdonella sp. TaxID=2291710 RepID=UPI002B644DB6|nr:PQQ-binding-like beta-propeller repeat protein [Dokdonella sp.]HUD40763.1 PQQ-binding-like beta-propeller repeat protein [Dokdonella sp.]